MQKAIAILKELAAEGKEIAKRRYESCGHVVVDSDKTTGWATSVLAQFEQIFGREDVRTEKLSEIVKRLLDISDFNTHNQALAILEAAARDLEKGWVFDLPGLLAAEVFDDFLGISHHLLEEGYCVPAASLGGAVLEDALRRLCKKCHVKWSPPSNIKKLNDVLRDKGVYLPAQYREIQVWEDVRNQADHGEFEEVDGERVRRMLEGINQFLAGYLK